MHALHAYTNCTLVYIPSKIRAVLRLLVGGVVMSDLESKGYVLNCLSGFCSMYRWITQ